MEIIGKIIKVLPERSGVSARNGSEWKVASYVLETVSDRFPRKMVFEVFGSDKIQQFAIQSGEMVRVSFDIDAHEYNGRWYGQLEAYDVTVIDEEKKEEPKQTSLPSSAPAYTPKKSEPEAPDADLPF